MYVRVYVSLDAVRMCVCICMYVHTYYVLTKPPISSSPCDLMESFVLFFLHRKKAITQGFPLVTTSTFIFFFFFRLITKYIFYFYSM